MSRPYTCLLRLAGAAFATLLCVSTVPVRSIGQNTAVSVPAWIQPYTGIRRNDIDSSTIIGKVLCGYQGWFRAPGDPSGGGWVHWSRDGSRIAPETLTFEMWPDMSEYSADEQYPAAGFSYPNGKQASLFSSANPKTVDRHFDWMRQYGIDGVLVQRFLGLDGAKRSIEAARVLGAVRNAANRTGRVFAVEYDMSGTPPDRALDQMQKDWRLLVDEMKITEDPRYLKQNGKPVVAIFGFFTDRFSGEWANRIIDGFHAGDRYSGFLIGGCQWWWRTETKDADWVKAFRRFDAIKPWNVGNWGTYNGIVGARTDYWQADAAEAKQAGMLYLPVLYPGFSWNNLQRKPPDTPGIPRLRGQFLKSQFQTLVSNNITQAFVAMFDEVDEGTAIFKVTNTPPIPGHFATFEGLPPDTYLKLTGEGTRLLHEAAKRKAVR